MSTTIAAEMLRKARALLEDKRRWTRGEFARNKAGQMVAPLDSDAAKWCAVGALQACSDNDWDSHYAARDLLRKCLPGPYTVIPKFNDNRKTKHADVLALFDCAIQKAEASDK